MMNRRQFGLSVAGTAAALTASPFSGSLSGSFGNKALAADKLKVGFVYVGPVSDHGYSYQHDLGRKHVAQHFGDKIETTYVENVAEGPDAERGIQQLAQGGLARSE